MGELKLKISFERCTFVTLLGASLLEFGLTAALV